MVFSFIGRIPLHQLFVTTLVGITSGVYIFRPLLERYADEHGLKNKQKEHSSGTDTAAPAVHDVKSSTPDQKQEDAKQKESVGNTSAD